MRRTERRDLPAGEPSFKIAELEREILVALCGGTLRHAIWSRASRVLADYPWQDPEHRVVYGAIRQVRSRDPKTWRDQLPAEATRMGFPDVDWKDYLAPETKDQSAKLKGMLARLAALKSKPQD